MKLKGKTIFIFVEQHYQDIEVWYPYHRLKEEGARVILVGTKAHQTYLGKYGYPAVSDQSVMEVSSKEADGIVIPGGYAPDYMRRQSEFISLVKEMDEQGKPIACICHGAWLLASAEIIKDRPMTCFYAIKQDAIHAGGLYRDEAVVVDKNLVTSRGQEDLAVFMKAYIDVFE